MEAIAVLGGAFAIASGLLGARKLFARGDQSHREKNPLTVSPETPPA